MKVAVNKTVPEIRRSPLKFQMPYTPSCDYVSGFKGSNTRTATLSTRKTQNNSMARRYNDG